jgi:prephenate dehydrogenase
MKKIETAAIIGVGLIGGSIGMALKKRTDIKITGIGRHYHKLEKAFQLRAVDEITTDFCQGVKEADLVIIATPVEMISAMVKKLLPYFKEGAIITDAGSVKGPIVEEIEKMISGHRLFFVGGHPMAGSEQKGIETARPILFREAVCILTPTPDTSPSALKIVKDLWIKMGARVIKMSPLRHDEIVAVTSHLPHILAYSLVDVFDQTAKNDPNVSLMVAGSFKDMTRVASSDPLLWSGICLKNKDNVLAAIEKFARILKEIEKLIGKKKQSKLLKKLAYTKNVRDNVFKKVG